jgi:hypothetical protein
MYCAPSVEYPVGRSFFAQLAFLLLMLVWSAGQGFWLLSATQGSWPGAWWFSTVSGLLCGAWGFWRLRRPVYGSLRWEAAAAQHGSGEATGSWLWFSSAYRRGTPLERIEWVWDLQQVVLLRLHNAAGLTWWVWLESAGDPAQWDDIRRALKAHEG